jgi:amidase
MRDMQPRSADQGWLAIAAARRKLIDSKIPRAWSLPRTHRPNASSIDDLGLHGILTEEEAAITNLGAVDLVEAIRNRIYTSAAVTLAFCKQAAIAHQLVRLTLRASISR